jgi:hypothetical protein
MRFGIAYALLVVVTWGSGFGTAYVTTTAEKVTEQQAPEFPSDRDAVAWTTGMWLTYLDRKDGENACALMTETLRAGRSVGECAERVTSAFSDLVASKLRSAGASVYAAGMADHSFVVDDETALTFELVQQRGRWLIEDLRSGL